MGMVLLKNEKDALTDLKEEISKKYKLLWMKLIGSKARGDFDEESDIDIVIALENADWDIERDIFETCFYLGLKYDIVISPIIYSEKDINDTFTRITPFYRTVESEGILI